VKTEDKYQLIVMRTKYLKNTLELSNKIAEQAHQLFLKYLNERMGIEPPKQEEKEEQNSEVSTQNTFDQEELKKDPIDPEATNERSEDRIEAKKEEKDGNLKKVFRQIASKIHPDKLERFSDFEKNLKSKLFEKARTAFQKNDYYGIVEVAEELNIDLPPPTQDQIELMKKTNKEIEKKINVLKKSVVWKWHHAEEESEKNSIMDRYIDYLNKNNLRP
jgi:hypothetical protein